MCVDVHVICMLDYFLSLFALCHFLTSIYSQWVGVPCERNSYKFYTNLQLSPFSDLAFCEVKQPCEQNICRTV